MLSCVLCVVGMLPATARADAPAGRATTHPRRVLGQTVRALEDIVQPPSNAAPRTFVANWKVTRAEGLPGAVAGATGQVAFQAPDHLRISATVDGQTYSAARDGNELWVDEPGKQFAVLGRNGIAPFRAEPGNLDATIIPPFGLPVSRTRIALATYMLNADALRSEKIANAKCQVLRLTLRPTAQDLLGVKTGTIDVWVRDADHLVTRIVYSDGAHVNVQVDLTDVKLSAPWTADQWKLHPAAGEHVATVALGHLMKFIELAPAMLTEKCPTLPPATGERTVVASCGKGRLEMIDGTRVLFLKGSPREMGLQHGTLLKKEIHDVANRILYGVGVGSSFAKGSWFISDIEAAEARLEPFMDKRYLEEEDAIADAAGMDRQEARLANFFPELFHCTGFSLMGKSTKDGHIYHGRVLDYLKGVGLEQNAVVIVCQPDYGNAWVNLSYAGFVGSISAMNEKGISIGEMGGRGEGQWDGKPMAHLMREVMEKAGTLDEAVQIMRNSPRTCQYYYVISDGKTHDAIGIAANPREFITIKPGEFNALLPHPMPDTVLMSAGKRYEELARRVKANYGQFDMESARHLMDPPVCMNSNIQSVLFEPDTLDFWVANADARNVASLTRYTHYNLKELLGNSRR